MGGCRVKNMLLFFWAERDTDALRAGIAALFPKRWNAVFSGQCIELGRADPYGLGECIFLIGDTLALILPQFFQNRVGEGQLRAE